MMKRVKRFLFAFVFIINVYPFSSYAPPPPPSVVTIYPTNTAPPGIDEGASDDFIRFYFLTDVGTAFVTSITVTKAGTVSDANVQASLYRSSDTIWDAGDTLIGGPLPFSGGVTTFSGLAELVGDTIYNYYFIVLTVSPGTGGQTAGANFVDPCFSVDVGNPVCTTTSYSPVPINVPVVVSDTLAVEPYDIAPLSVTPGQTNVAVLQIDMYALSGDVTWNSITLNLSGTGAVDTDISAIKIYKENWVTPGFQPAEDILISSGGDTFSGGLANIVLSSPQTIGGSVETFYIVYDISSSANTSHNVGLLLQSDAFNISPPDTVSSANLPYITKEVDIIVPGSNIGTLSYIVSSCNKVTLSWLFSGDENLNSYTRFQYGTNSTWGDADDVTACSEVRSVQPRNCTVVGIDLSISPLYFRAVHHDPDGTSGGTSIDPQTAYIAIGPVNCASTSGEVPVVNIISPSNGEIVAGNSLYPVKIIVSVWDKETPPTNLTLGLSVNGGAWDTTGWTYNSNWENVDINLYVYEKNWIPSSPGLYTLSVRAVDGNGNAGYSYYNVQVYVNSVNTVNIGGTQIFPGSGLLLVRGGSSALCMACHSVATHGGFVWSSTKYGNWSVNCRVCHTPHGTKNIYLIRETITTPSSGNKPVDFRKRGGNPATDAGLMGNMQDGVDTNICEVCHTKTSHYKNNNLGDDHGGKDGIDCIGCHVHSAGFKPSGESSGGSNCATCHSDLFTPMNSSTTTYHHYLNNAEAIYPVITDPANLGTDAPERRCLICHVDHNIFRPDLNSGNTTGRSANLRTSISTAPPSPPTSSGFTNTDFNSITGESICISCHQFQMNKNLTKRKTSDGVSQTIPVSGTNFLSSSHNYPVPMTVNRDASIFNANCIKCHNDTNNPKSSVNAYAGTSFPLAPHFSYLRWLLNPFDLNPSDPFEEGFCFKCHSGNTAGKDYFGVKDMTQKSRSIQSTFSKTYKHNIAGTTGAHKTIEGTSPNWLPATSRHVECTDCHNPHEALTGNHTPGQGGLGNSTKGVWGVQVTSYGDKYTGGTANFTSGSCTVTGNGTNWSSIPNPTQCNIRCTTESTKPFAYPILSVTSNTQLTIKSLRDNQTTCYEGSCGANSSYEIVCPRNVQYSRIESVSYQYQICLKCHSSYAWGSTPPNSPSGGPNNQVWPETDVGEDFSIHNLAYHPLFAPGRFQPPNNANPNWSSSAGRKSATSSKCATNPNQGYDNTFVDCWGKSSLVTCSDCHSTDSPGANIPEGPHGSSYKWILKGLDQTVTVTLANGTVITPNTNSAVTNYPRNFCVNCHRADIYFPPYTGTKYGVLSRFDHDAGINDNCFQTFGVNGTGNRYDVPCMNCHGGRAPGEVHGSNLGVGTSGLSPQGFRFMNGASWVGHTTGLTGGTCYTLSTANDLSNCTQHAGGRNYTSMNFQY